MTVSVFPPLPVEIQYRMPKVDPTVYLKTYIDSQTWGQAEDLAFELYPQPSRGPDAEGSYLVRLPPGYDESDEHYPVIYWLHGGLQTQRTTEWALQFYGRKMEEGLMPKVIIIGPQVLTQGRYINSYDGKRPLATIVSKDLVTAIDARFRTIRHPSARWIEGFSMGGYGTLHLGFTYPDIFGALSCIAGALLWNMDDEPPSLTGPTYGGNRTFWDHAHPYYLAGANRKKVGNVPLRVISGGADFRLAEAIPRMLKRFKELDYEYEHQEVPSVGHFYEPLLAGVGDFAWTWWQEVRTKVVETE